MKGKETLGRSRHRWEVNIKTSLKGTDTEGVNLIHMSQDRDP
jgi:hypothetical protein